MAHTTEHVAALGLDDLGGVLFHRCAECVIHGQKKPVLATLIDDGPGRAFGQRHGVVGVVHGVGAALLVGQQ